MTAFHTIAVPYEDILAGHERVREEVEIGHIRDSLSNQR